MVNSNRKVHKKNMQLLIRDTCKRQISITRRSIQHEIFSNRNSTDESPQKFLPLKKCPRTWQMLKGRHCHCGCKAPSAVRALLKCSAAHLLAPFIVTKREKSNFTCGFCSLPVTVSIITGGCLCWLCLEQA